MDSTELLCKDCKHSFRPWYDCIFSDPNGYTYKCRKGLRPEKLEENLVVGNKHKAAHYESCSTMRRDFDAESTFRCGSNAKFWTPKRSTDLFKFIKVKTSS